MKIICRPLLLHNEFMPARMGDENARKDWKYQVFGYHDGITIKKRFEVNSANELEEVFKTYVNYESELRPYFTQFLFGFSDCAERDQEFWSYQAPFLYISLLQFHGKDILTYKKALECINEKDVQAIVYYSLDNSDLILVLKCQEAIAGADYIDKLHWDLRHDYPFQLQNSYSIFGLDKEWITDAEWGEDRTDLLELRLINRNSENADKLYEKIKESLPENDNDVAIGRKLLFGTDDQAIFLKGLKWKDIISLYQKDTGILCNSNSCEQAYSNAVTTKVMWPLERHEQFDDLTPTTREEPSLRLSKIMSQKLLKIYKDKSDAKSIAEKKNLMMLISALSRFEAVGETKEGFSDYSFFSLLFPLYIFINLLEEKNEEKMEIPSVFYYEFLKHLKLCTQNFTKPDRVYMQVADFNMRYFQTPEKLVALYNAYIYYFKLCFDKGNNDRRYEFLVCPGVNSRIEVKELFARFSEKSRLVMIELPEHQIYRPQTMFVALGHEIAHFVGRDIRLRSVRYDIVNRMMCHVIVLVIRNFLELEECVDKSVLREVLWEKVEEDLEEKLSFYVKRICDIDYLKNIYFGDGITENVLESNWNFNKKNFQHTQVFQKVLASSIEDMLTNRGTEIFGFLIEDGMRKRVETSGYENIDKFIQQQKEAILRSINFFLREYNTQSQTLTLNKAIDKIMYLMRECYADVICILTLRLSVKDYYMSFIQAVDSKEEEFDEFKDTILMTRIAIVTHVMAYKAEAKYADSKYYRWTKALQKGEADDRVYNLQEKVKLFDKGCIKNVLYVSPEELLNNIEMLNYDKYLLKEVIRYLLKCRREFYKTMDKKHVEKRMKDVQEIYEIVHDNTADELFGHMMNYIENYKRDIERDIEKL